MFFEDEDLEELFRKVGLEVLRIAPLGNLHPLVSGTSPAYVPGLTEFARRNLDMIAGIEKALHNQLDPGKALHLFIAGRKL